MKMLQMIRIEIDILEIRHGSKETCVFMFLYQKQALTSLHTIYATLSTCCNVYKKYFKYIIV